MNDIQLEDDLLGANKSHVDISSKEEVEELSNGLADDYVGYFIVDTAQQQQRLEESIEECLTHLEEVCSTLDGHRQNSDEIKYIVEHLANKNESLNKLYDQIDALEQYITVANRSLNQLEASMNELDGHRKFGVNRIRKMIDIVPRLSFNNIPRFGLFTSIGGLFEDPLPGIIDQRNTDAGNSIASINEILSEVSIIESSITSATSDFNARLNTNEIKHPKFDSNSMVADCESTDQVDGSWQELL